MKPALFLLHAPLHCTRAHFLWEGVPFNENERMNCCWKGNCRGSFIKGYLNVSDYEGVIMQYHTWVCCYQWWPLALALQPHQHGDDVKYNSTTSNVILPLSFYTNSIYYTIHCHTFISQRPLRHKTTQPSVVILSSSTHGTPLVQSKFLVRANCCIVVK